MSFQGHAIAAGARRFDFWPSVAEASAQLRRHQRAEVGRERPGHFAAPRLSFPAGLGGHRSSADVRR
jgi:hypothetical protein